MATINSYTNIKQSKELAKILPIESADMHWQYIEEDNGQLQWFCFPKDISINQHTTVSAWSLSALLNILPTIDDRNVVFCKDIRCDKWHVFYHGTATLPLIDTERYHDIIDACYEIIIKLHELNLL